MQIALLSPLYESVPPKMYGGTERVVANLCRGLAELGHEVTLFASGDSTACDRLVDIVPAALRLQKTPRGDDIAYHLCQMAALINRADQYDVVHSHIDLLAFPLAKLLSTPVVSTMHGRLDNPAVVNTLQQYKDIPLVSISDFQQGSVPGINWIATVYHGLPIEDFEFHPKAGKYLAFLGRISREKRPDLAIQIARQAGVPLRIAAKIDEGDPDYYYNYIKPMIDGTSVEFIGEIQEHEKSEFLGNALGMVFPIDWPEPFGLAPVEAWACGTPVLARPYGSVQELHIDGLTGFVSNSIDYLVQGVDKLASFDRLRCRLYAEKNFSLHRMCEDYVNVYRRLKIDGLETEAPFQHGKPNGYQWGFLHSIGSLTARHS